MAERSNDVLLNPVIAARAMLSCRKAAFGTGCAFCRVIYYVMTRCRNGFTLCFIAATLALLPRGAARLGAGGLFSGNFNKLMSQSRNALLRNLIAAAFAVLSL